MQAEQERERIARKLTALDREVSRLLDAYQAEVIQLSELSERRQGVEAQGRMLRQRLREIAQQQANRENELRLLEGVEAFCRYHVVIVPKYRQKAIFGALRKNIGRILRELCEQVALVHK